MQGISCGHMITGSDNVNDLSTSDVHIIISEEGDALLNLLVGLFDHSVVPVSFLVRDVSSKGVSRNMSHKMITKLTQSYIGARTLKKGQILDGQRD